MIYVVMDSDDMILCVLDAAPNLYETIERARREFKAKYRAIASNFDRPLREKTDELVALGRVEDHLARVTGGKLVDYSKVY